ncbi:MAG: TIGR01212 family radical SAM protein [Peptococcaceae bacterium]|nr:TIGR01212 family radical SAM protein [Peptococcaceae bacterium]
MSSSKRYRSFNHHLREIFGEKVIKVALDAGLSCPNRDGFLSYGGCIFCSEKGSGDFAGNRSFSIKDQFHEVRQRTIKKWPKAKYIGYFQSFSGTYGPPQQLKTIYEEALKQKDVVGISISTRPDCLAPEILDILDELNRKTYLWVELGVQSVHEHSLVWMNRGHDFPCFIRALEELRKRNIRVCAHIILGLPCENRSEMMETALTMARLPIQGIKIHSLHILAGTPLAEIYRQKDLQLLSMQEYIDLVVDILEILPQDLVIHRLMGDGPSHLVLEPQWTRRKWEVLNGIDYELERRDSYQGRLFQNV